MDHIAKRQKVDELEAGEEAVLFNSDTLSKIIPYLPSIDVLNLALTCTRFSASKSILSTTVTIEKSLIEESTLVAIQDVATEVELATLPYYNGKSSLADYHYLQLIRAPLTFDQLVEAEYVNKKDKSSVKNSGNGDWETAFSNNILTAGKHYVSFKPLVHSESLMMGAMRPGQANQETRHNPLQSKFYQNFSPSIGCINKTTKVHCCMYNSSSGNCCTSDWSGSSNYNGAWGGSETIGMRNMSSRNRDEIGILLDLDEGTLSVYKYGRKLGVMKRGLTGPYCWVVSLYAGSSVAIKRGTIPQN